MFENINSNAFFSSTSLVITNAPRTKTLLLTRLTGERYFSPQHFPPRYLRPENKCFDSLTTPALFKSPELLFLKPFVDFDKGLARDLFNNLDKNTGGTYYSLQDTNNKQCGVKEMTDDRETSTNEVINFYLD